MHWFHVVMLVIFCFGVGYLSGHEVGYLRGENDHWRRYRGARW